MQRHRSKKLAGLRKYSSVDSRETDESDIMDEDYRILYELMGARQRRYDSRNSLNSSMSELEHQCHKLQEDVTRRGSRKQRSMSHGQVSVSGIE